MLNPETTNAPPGIQVGRRLGSAGDDPDPAVGRVDEDEVAVFGVRGERAVFLADEAGAAVQRLAVRVSGEFPHDAYLADAEDLDQFAGGEDVAANSVGGPGPPSGVGAGGDVRGGGGPCRRHAMNLAELVRSVKRRMA